MFGIEISTVTSLQRGFRPGSGPSLAKTFGGMCTPICEMNPAKRQGRDRPVHFKRRRIASVCCVTRTVPAAAQPADIRSAGIVQWASTQAFDAPGSLASALVLPGSKNTALFGFGHVPGVLIVTGKDWLT